MIWELDLGFSLPNKESFAANVIKNTLNDEKELALETREKQPIMLSATLMSYNRWREDQFD